MTRDELLQADVRKAERQLREARERLAAHRGEAAPVRMVRRERTIDARYKFLQDQARAARP